MRTMLHAVLAVALGGLIGSTAPAFAQHGDTGGGHEAHHAGETTTTHPHMLSQLHGGHSVMTPQHHFEVLFTPGEARVYIYDAEQNPMAAPEGLEGSIELKTKDGEKAGLDLGYVAPSPEEGRAQGYYAAPYDFAEIAEGSMEALVTMKGLAGKPVQFTTAVTVSEPKAYACPMSCVPPASDPMSCPKCGMEMKPVEGGHHMDEGGHEGHMDTERSGGHGGH